MFQIVDLRLEDALMCELLYESRHEMTSTSGVVLGIFFCDDDDERFRDFE